MNLVVCKTLWNYNIITSVTTTLVSLYDLKMFWHPDCVVYRYLTRASTTTMTSHPDQYPKLIFFFFPVIKALLLFHLGSI